MIKGIPWWAKLGAKLVLSRLPFDYRFWAKLGLFRHGAMASPEYAVGVFRKHYDAVTFPRKECGGWTGLELGPGDSLFSIPIAHAYGANKIWLSDSGSFANRQNNGIEDLKTFFESQGKHLDVSGSTWDDLLGQCNGTYLTTGLAGLAGIPTGSVDFIWSNAVLEHIPKGELLPLFKELKRVLRSDGMCSHSVDLRDHFNGGLNNLRFSAAVWEGDFFRKSGFYTNRVRYCAMIDLLSMAGFKSESLILRRFEISPLPRKKLDDAFAGLSDDELNVASFDILLSVCE